MEATTHRIAPGWSLEILREMEWKRFEELCARVFETVGYRVWTTVLRPDGGIDMIVSSPNPSDRGERIEVRCRAFAQNPVDVSRVQELVSGVRGGGFRAGVLVSTGEFSPESREYAESRDEVILIDGREFLGKVYSLPKADREQLLGIATHGDYTTPTCPDCALKMIRRIATQGAVSGREYWACPDINPRKCRRTFPVVGAEGEKFSEERGRKAPPRRRLEFVPAGAAVLIRNLLARRFGLRRPVS
ncbi:MAG: restriction endonuclease [Verrucomicrobiales bacterium]